MNVLVPSALRSYTERGEVEATGETLAALLADLERHYPGIRFRIVDEQERDLSRPLAAADEVIIVQALSGG
jgi:molybdopterin converting factor small subunit